MPVMTDDYQIGAQSFRHVADDIRWLASFHVSFNLQFSVLQQLAALRSSFLQLLLGKRHLIFCTADGGSTILARYE
ncbi:hypothetical protein SAMN06265795_109125 [Noviherbaspirillum humi]|uniref:Uncharacterized protein n=1 Tax=Noviherbaspirillum humi TaxID=1688639 RepID=A0A239IIG6_9BURK|nr:hypothetical protein SAMN06265795_109125 [Noviherbaspirillum humi]